MQLELIRSFENKLNGSDPICLDRCSSLLLPQQVLNLKRNKTCDLPVNCSLSTGHSSATSQTVQDVRMSSCLFTDVSNDLHVADYLEDIYEDALDLLEVSQAKPMPVIFNRSLQQNAQG